MSHEESIYNLIPRSEAELEKNQRHKSKFRRMVIDESRANKSLNKTLGPAKVETRPPDQFLRKHEKEPRLPPSQKFIYPDADHKKPAVPGRDERPIMGERTTKDFVTQNAVETIRSVPRQPQRNMVDTRRGDKMALEPSGLEPIHLHKKEYGETPEYIKKRKEEMRRQQEQYDAYIAEHFRRGTMKQLTPEERAHILAGLKENWEQVHKQYLQLSVVIDTVPKIQHKERLECQLKQLEKDIEMLEIHNTIYVAN